MINDSTLSEAREDVPSPAIDDQLRTEYGVPSLNDTVSTGDLSGPRRNTTRKSPVLAQSTSATLGEAVLTISGLREANDRVPSRPF